MSKPYQIRFSLRTFLTLLTVFCAVLGIVSRNWPAKCCLVETKEPLDVAIVGDAYFRVVNASGEVFYTRSGEFQLNENGALSLRSSDALVEPYFAIPSAGDVISISYDGRVQAEDAVTGNFVDVGTLQLFAFADLKALEPHARTGLLKPVGSDVVASPVFLDRDRQLLLLQGWRSAERPILPSKT